MGIVKDVALVTFGGIAGFYITCKFYDNDPQEFIDAATGKTKAEYQKILAKVKTGKDVNSDDDLDDEFVDEDIASEPVEEPAEETAKVEAEVVQ